MVIWEQASYEMSRKYNEPYNAFLRLETGAMADVNQLELGEALLWRERQTNAHARAAYKLAGRNGTTAGAALIVARQQVHSELFFFTSSPSLRSLSMLHLMLWLVPADDPTNAASASASLLR